MEKKSKKILLVVSALVLIGGGLGYWLWKRKKDKSSETGEQKTLEEAEKSKAGSSNSGSASQTDKPSDVLAFQKYANSKGWSPKLKEDGIWGSKSASAWKKWGSDFKKQISSPPTPQANKKDVSALMLQNPNGIIGKNIYAKFTGSTIRDVLNDKVIGTSKKDELLGMVTSVSRTSSGAYFLTGKTPIGGYFTVLDSTVYYY